VLPGTANIDSLTKRQTEIYHVIEEHRAIALQELLRLTGTTAQTVRKLEDKNLIEIAPQITERDPYANEQIVPTTPLKLNPEQAKAVEKITAESGKVFLLHGVTGSGKTEVYLQAIARALEEGKGAIVLVPEISLTPQTVERFKARFSSGPLQTLVAVLHSHLSTGERHDEWHKIRQGRAKIVIGARSAIFAPVEPLGLIIVDEEHEHSYKQEEAPRYHARDVAVVRGQREGATVVLGSATPSLESYHNAKRGKYTLLEMPSRVDDKRMPLVRVLDMRTEKSKGDKGPPIFSQRLKDAIHHRLEAGEQTILFLNRRGFATSMQCPDCGLVAECPNCSLSLTYHRREQSLRCHICGHRDHAPKRCPNEKCRSPKIRFHGLGTEKVEDVLRKLFPKANVCRMDSDALKRKDDFRRILGDFRRGKIDILVGTQMIAKGLHFPRVTLVGIVYADTSLHLADFRAGERTFQLLTQVAGRAGRGDVEGEVVVQTFSPSHPAIQFARHHDFEGYFETEMEFREQLLYPPFTRAALLTIRGRNEDKVKFSADHIKRELEKIIPKLPDLVIAGPAPAPLLRAENFYRYQIMLRLGQMSALSRHLALLDAQLTLPDDVTLTIDIDPVNLS
jgi:primosomal protein N' (replication factor Y)